MLQPKLQRLETLRLKNLHQSVPCYASRVLPTHIQRKILRILIAFPLAQLVTYLMGYGTSPTCLISTAMVLFSASPLETAVYKKMNERIFSNLLGIVIGYVSTLMVEPPTARIIIGGLMIVFVAYWFPKLNISPASTSVAMLIVAEAPRYEMYLSLQERAFLVVLGCVIAYIVVRFIVPPRHHKTLYAKAVRLSKQFVHRLQAMQALSKADRAKMRFALAHIKKETDRYSYIIDNMNKSKDPQFVRLAQILKSLDLLKGVIQYMQEHDDDFEQLAEPYQEAFRAELARHLEYHAALLDAESFDEEPLRDHSYSFGELPYHKAATSFFYPLDLYGSSLDSLQHALTVNENRVS